MIPTTNCRGCGKPVVFAVDEKGTTQVLDMRAPVFRIFQRADGSMECARLEKEVHGVSHFATCSHANQFSKGKKKEVDRAPRSFENSEGI